MISSCTSKLKKLVNFRNGVGVDEIRVLPKNEFNCIDIQLEVCSLFYNLKCTDPACSIVLTVLITSVSYPAAATAVEYLI